MDKFVDEADPLNNFKLNDKNSGQKTGQGLNESFESKYPDIAEKMKLWLMDSQQYNIWIKPLRFMKEENGVITLLFPDQEFIESHRKELEDFTHKSVVIKCEVTP